MILDEIIESFFTSKELLPELFCPAMGSSHIDTTGKKSGRLLSTLYFQALTFMQFIHVLDPRDHNLALPYLALPYLALYLVVSFIACVGCLVSRLVN